MHQGLAAVIDASDENEFAFAPNQHGALQMSHIEQKKRVVREDLRVSEFECVKCTDRGELKYVGRHTNFICSRDDLFYLASQDSADEIFGLSDIIALNVHLG